MAVSAGGQLDRAQVLPAANDRFVERMPGTKYLPGTEMLHAQHHAVLDPRLAVEHLVEVLAAILVFDLDEIGRAHV